MKDQRIREMENYIVQKKSVTLKELCDTFHVSMNTVRRDINDIVARTNIKKTYGGVCLQPAVSAPSTFSERNRTNETIKRLIAKKAAEYICENDIVYIDTGTTTMHLLDYVPTDMHLTVITNSFHIVRSAIDRPEITLISLPGMLNRKTMSFGGGENFHYLESFSIHKAFMACTGISVQSGATNSFSDEYVNKKTASGKANQVFMMADSSKFNVSTLMSYCPLSKIDYLITDRMPNEDIARVISEAQHHLVLCNYEG